MGGNLRATSRNFSNYVPPLRRDAVAGLGAIVIPTARRVPTVKRSLLASMALAEGHGVYLVVLCSGDSRPADVERLAGGFTRLKWVVIDGPFRSDVAEDGLAEFVASQQSDLPDKRNFGLALARLMGWQAVLFLDDDIRMSESMLERQADLMRSGAALVACNARD